MPSPPLRGEIDIMENVGNEPSTAHGTVHGPGYSGPNSIGRAYVLLNGGSFSEDFHIFSIDWSEDSITFYVDGNRYHQVTRADLPSGGQWVFDHPFFVLLDVAVGGRWPGNPDATTSFPQEMLVDYVRVYRRTR